LNGNLYGTVIQGFYGNRPGAFGMQQDGHIFALRRLGAVRTTVNLFLAANKIYGTSTKGGSKGDCDHQGCGTAFSLSSDKLEPKRFYVFGGKLKHFDAIGPDAPALAVGNYFYGPTQTLGFAHDGTVYQLTAAGSESTVHTFTGGTDGSEPLGTLTKFGGSLYGTTRWGGNAGCLSPDGCGTVYRIRLTP
jgi:uncharacterized repeat protein (TIGR03803 family)